MLPFPEILAQLAQPTLDELVRVVGPIPGLAPNATRTETERALFRHYAGFRAPIHVVDDIADMFSVQAAASVFSILPRIASEEAYRGVLQCAGYWGDPRSETWASWSPIEVAAALAIEIATTMDVPGKSPQYERAKCLVHAGRRHVDAAPTERPTYELNAVSPIELNAVAIKAAIQRELGADAVELWSARDAADGSLLVAVFVRRAVLTEPVFREDGIQIDQFRPVTVDLLRVFADGARVSLTLDERPLLRRYAKALGLSLCPSVTLRRIRPETFDALQARAPAGMKVEVDHLGFRFANGSECTVDGDDPWPDATPLWKGKLRSVGLRIKDKHGRVFSVLLQRPHRVEIPELMTSLLARTLLKKLRLLRITPPPPKPARQKRESKTDGNARAPRVRVLH